MSQYNADALEALQLQFYSFVTQQSVPWRQELAKVLKEVFNLKNVRNARIWLGLESTFRSFISPSPSIKNLESRIIFARGLLGTIPPNVPTRCHTFATNNQANEKPLSKFPEYWDVTALTLSTVTLHWDGQSMVYCYNIDPSDGSEGYEDIDLGHSLFDGFRVGDINDEV